MRLKEFFYLVGFRPSIRFYPYEFKKIDYDKGEKSVYFAKWLAPKAYDISENFQNEIDELRLFLKDGDTAIDIGANIGDSTLPIAAACGGAGTVFAFEPNPATYTVLGACAAKNFDRAKIIPMPFAATSEDCTMTFDYGDPWLGNGGDHSTTSKWRHGSAFSIPVKGINVEKLLRLQHGDKLNRLRYIKIDVEGWDFMVLKSLEGLIKEFRPYIKAEVNRDTTAHDREAMFKFFTDLNYELRKVEGRRKLFGVPLTRKMMDDPITFDLFAMPK